VRVAIARQHFMKNKVLDETQRAPRSSVVAVNHCKIKKGTVSANDFWTIAAQYFKVNNSRES
jgi:hypothetical protein